MKCSLGISNFHEEISSLSILLFSSVSLHWSLRKAFLSLLAILWNSAFKWVYLSFTSMLFTSLLFTAICKASSDSHFAFLHRDTIAHRSIWAFTWNVRRTVSVCANTHCIHLSLTPAFRAMLPSQNLLVGYLNTCDVPNTVLGAFRNSSVSATSLFWINKLLCKIKITCSCFSFPRLVMEKPGV